MTRNRHREISFLTAFFFRPAFLEEFTALERELEKLFVQYSIRVRCLNQLEHLAADAERVRLEQQLAAASQKIVETVPLENVEINDAFNLEEKTSDIQSKQIITRQERPRARTGG